MGNEIKLFEGKQVRSAWDNEKEEWYFSVVDVVAVLTDSKNPRDYWYRVKKRMSEEKKVSCRHFVDNSNLQRRTGKNMRQTLLTCKEFCALFNQYHLLKLNHSKCG